MFTDLFWVMEVAQGPKERLDHMLSGAEGVNSCLFFTLRYQWNLLVLIKKSISSFGE